MTISWRPILLSAVVICACLFLSTVAAKPGSSKMWAAEPFSDPDYVVQMPDGWKKQVVPTDKNKLVVSLDKQMYQVLTPHIKKYGQKHNLNIDIFDGTCGNSAGMLRRKMVDIGGFCCPPNNTDRLPGIRFHALGITAVSLLVNPDNQIDNITLEQARDIFRGEIYRWSELKKQNGHPGPDVPIQTIVRLHCKTRPGHWRLLLAKEEFFSIRAKEVGLVYDMNLNIASNPMAIGHAAWWLAVSAYKDKGMVKSLKINGYDPIDLDALILRGYPLYKSFFLTTWDEEGMKKPHAEKLTEYLKEFIENQGRNYGIVSASQLKQAGWRFKGEELVGHPPE
jgi:hypothetical protein